MGRFSAQFSRGRKIGRGEEIDSPRYAPRTARGASHGIERASTTPPLVCDGRLPHEKAGAPSLDRPALLRRRRQRGGPKRGGGRPVHHPNIARRIVNGTCPKGGRNAAVQGKILPRVLQDPGTISSLQTPGRKRGRQERLGADAQIGSPLRTPGRSPRVARLIARGVRYRRCASPSPPRLRRSQGAHRRASWRARIGRVRAAGGGATRRVLRLRRQKDALLARWSSGRPQRVSDAPCAAAPQPRTLLRSSVGLQWPKRPRQPGGDVGTASETRDTISCQPSEAKRAHQMIRLHDVRENRPIWRDD